MGRRRSRSRSSKREVLARVFDLCQARGEYVFHNDLVQEVSQQLGFSNKYDATKIDHSSKYPANMQQGKGWFLVHLGKGFHQFVEDQSLGFHQFERVDEEEAVEWQYVPSILNDFDSSEANVLSIAYNQLILHDFLYGDRRANPQVYFARRTKHTGDYTVSGKRVEVTQVQLEMDLVLERKSNVTIFEAKKGFHEDFATYQLFHPHLYFEKYRRDGTLKIGDIQCCFLQKHEASGFNVMRFHLYRFHERQLDSIELIRKKEYILSQRDPL